MKVKATYKVIKYFKSVGAGAVDVVVDVLDVLVVVVVDVCAVLVPGTH
jgi:hypothetical protein